MDEMIREEEFLGNRKVLVGSNKLDLVLEAFGNIYVKTGDSTKTLDELLKSIGSKTTEEVVKTMTILDTYANLVSLVYPGDGMFIYVKSNTTLYLASEPNFTLSQFLLYSSINAFTKAPFALAFQSSCHALAFAAERPLVLSLKKAASVCLL